MNREEKLLKAKELGIQDADALKGTDLDNAIKGAVKRKELVAKATDLGIEAASDFLSDELELLIMATENTVLAAKLNVFCAALGIDNVSELSLEELENVVEGHIVRFNSLATKSVEVNAEELVEPKGRTAKAFKTEGGKKYVFSADAPPAFRFAGAMKTQEDWIDDKESMQLMVDGELEYLTLKND